MIVFEPTVYLIGKQIVVRHELQKFLDKHKVSGWTTNAPSAGEELAEIGGRVCYMSFPKPRPGGNLAYLEHIKEVGHGSVVEHATYTLLIEGISRSLTHEFVRHRHISPSQLSQRYVDAVDTEYVCPPDIAIEVKMAQLAVYFTNYEKDIESLMKYPDHLIGQYALKYGIKQTIKAIDIGNAWINGCEHDSEQYEELTKYLAEKAPAHLVGTERRKYARQTARSVLPNATETKIQMTGNGRSWRNFIELRASRHADSEIRVLAGKVWEKLVEESPNLFGDYEKIILEDGTFELKTKFTKI